MQRRIGLAQALINDPQLLILDEPTTGMDPIGTRQIKDLILRLKQRGKTILLCSHLLADVEDVCDRVAIMYGGKIREMGTINELLLNEQETTLHTQRLSQAEIERIQELLTSWGKSANAQQPRQKLEDKFLDIVEQAQKEGLATSGARAGGRIAEFLTGSKAEPQKQEARGKRLLDQLTQEAPSPPREPAEPEPTPQTAPESRTDQGVLQSLTQDDSPEQPEPRSHQEAEPMEAQAEKSSQERDKPEPDRGLLDRLTKGS
jgi:ABC-2 type transport system ATP-binding protein